LAKLSPSGPAASSFAFFASEFFITVFFLCIT
jgi:hypothetical protein